jgi:hypothetical protein
VSDAWVEVAELKARLVTFFAQQRDEIGNFGSTVNQTFEAFVFAQTVGWYRARGWAIEVQNPRPQKDKPERFRLKFTTRGRPAGFSYVRCTSPDGTEIVQVRHQLRVATRAYREDTYPRSNICLDVAVIRDLSLEHYDTNDHVPNHQLVSFGEAKHMSAFAELIAGFIGLVHELQPERLKRTRSRRRPDQPHPAPFLFVSGHFWRTAEGLNRTIMRRRYDIDVFNKTKALTDAIKLPTEPGLTADVVTMG